MARPVSAAARWLPAFLAAATLLVWFGSLDGAFVFDDLSRIVHNPQLHSLEHPGRLLADTSRPVLKLSLAANYAAGGENPFGYHLVNLVIHLLAGLALFGVIHRTLLGEGVRAETADAAPWLAGSVALLWLLHPLQTQAVTYVVQRGESLMGLAALTTLYCSIRAVRGPRYLLWGGAAVAACALGMGTKEVMVVVPALVLLHDRTFESGSFAAALHRHTALYAGLAATWLVPFALIGTDTLFRGEFARPELPTLGVLEYGLNQPQILLHYLRLVFWPSPLCFDYQWSPATSLGEILPSALLVGGALVATAWWVWRGSWLGFAASWFFLILAPTSSFLPIQDLAVEHRMYLPLAAPLSMVVILGYLALAPMGPQRARLGGLLVALAAIALGLTTADRNRDYRDEVTLWRSVVAAAPANARAYYNLGTQLRNRGELEPAISAFRRSLELAPEQPKAHYNLANALKQAGEIDAAIDHYQRNLELLPGHAAAHVNLANAFFSRSDYQPAIRHYQLALASDPDYPGAHYNLGVVLERDDQNEAAIAAYREALRLRPRSAATHNNLGNVLLARGELDEAIRHYRRAIAFDHDHVRARHNLGLALEAAGEPERAAESYRMALEIDPDYALARQRLDAIAVEQKP